MYVGFHYGFLGYIFIGLLAGWLAGLLSKGSGFGFVGNIFIGIVGAFIGGFLFRFLGIHYYGFVGSLAAATVGAVLLIAVAGLAKK